MISYKCDKCDKHFLNGVDLSHHIENQHGQIPSISEKKCPQCFSKKISFIAKAFENGKEKHHIYYCSVCKQALKIELN
ncbi:MAG: hypothetical protein NT026_02975 [Candidatus Staskawiczbacteria bacterium]|nr:hypothetical protein [Candidatus Staskawiczbacteria bacterium]